METKQIEQIIRDGMQIGCIRTLSELGLYPENISEKQAHKLYSKKSIEDWRLRGWITAYPSGNSNRSKFYFKRSELDVAKHMISIQNSIPFNKIFHQNSYGKSKHVDNNSHRHSNDS